MDHTLKLLKQMAHGIAKQFGTSCEVVIHDLNKDLETSIVHIENGQVTHRKSGDGPSGIVLETLHKTLPKYKISFLISHARRTAGFEIQYLHTGCR